MDNIDLPEQVKKFIFEYIDSVELLDILLLLNADRNKTWSSSHISSELRTNPSSVKLRLESLINFGLIKESRPNSDEYQYASKSAQTDQAIHELATFNITKRHRILRLIFSPLKQIRVLADGFRVSSKKPEGGNNNG